ncbi:MAG: PQQ-dependent sugar dehydrogenase [Acidobacteriota bacterium]|nr:PQQ-dependent sugar dehydrogenase [Acidobacteriota bacterium]
MKTHPPFFLPAVVLLVCLCSLPSLLGEDGAPSDAPRIVPTKGGARLRVETIVTGLEVPWSIAFSSPRRMLVTERPGRVRVVEDGVLRSAPLATIADVESTGETGLMGLALAPDYASSRLLYLSYAYRGASPRVRVEQYRDEGTRIVRTRTILDGLPAAQFHAGCRLRFGPDGKLYVTTGDATDRALAQKMDSLAGKTLRLNPDGSIPPDNPFPGSPIFSLGHRNSQGLDWQTGSGLQFQTEHGPSGFDGPGGGDEVNIVEAGKNYGWPIIHHRQTRPGLVSPLLEFTPAIAPSGASFARGRALASFAGDFFFAALRGERLVRVRFAPQDPRRVAFVEDLFSGEYGRLREVMSGPDGALYVSTSNRDGRGRVRNKDDRILRISEP